MLDEVKTDVTIQAIRNAIVAELRRAVGIHGWFVSKHHALGVLLEEWDELKETITHDESPERIYEEAIQVSAMAMEIAVVYGPAVVNNPHHTPVPPAEECSHATPIDECTYPHDTMKERP